MELVHAFSVAVPVEQTWAVLTDVERIAPCLPGAQLTSVEGDEFHGTVKVKVGPIVASYRGTASFAEKDDVAHRAVIRASGKEGRGQGNASATITAALTPTEAGGTDVSVTTDLTISGKVAQFGRGMLADVSSALLQQFVAALEADLLGGPPSAGGAAGAGVPAPAAAPVPAASGASVAPAGNVDHHRAVDLAQAAADRAQAAAERAVAAADRAAAAGKSAPAAGGELSLLPVILLPLAKRLAPVLGFVAVVGALVARRRGR